MKKLYIISLVLVIVLLLCISNFVFAAEKVVKIGILLPLTGKLALDGACLKKGMDLAVEIINNKTDIDVPLGKTEGLPNLGGAKIELVYADDQGLPERGMSEAERLIASGEVVVLFGCYTSATTATAQMVAEKYKFPLMSIATSPMLNKKGLKWFFQNTPDDTIFMRSFFDFLEDRREATGTKYETVAIIHEDSLWGTDCGQLLFDFAHEYDYKIVANLAFSSGTVDLTSEVQRIKIADPDILFEICYAQDQILLVKTMKFLDVNVDVLFSGVQYPDIFDALQKDAEGMIFREVFNEDSAEVNPTAKKMLELWKANYGDEGMGNSPRATNAIFVLADAINRAGATDPESIRKALVETDIPKEKVFLSWNGVKFGENGLNEKANAIMAFFSSL